MCRFCSTIMVVANKYSSTNSNTALIDYFGGFEMSWIPFKAFECSKNMKTANSRTKIEEKWRIQILYLDLTCRVNHQEKKPPG